MKIYLASRYSRQAEMAAVADQLEATGHEVTSRWIRGDHLCNDDQLLNDPAWAQKIANDDVEDLFGADTFVLFTDPVRTPTRGGKQFEAGCAYTLGLELVLIGRAENVFQSLSSWVCFETTEEFLLWLKGRHV